MKTRFSGILKSTLVFLLIFQFVHPRVWAQEIPPVNYKPYVVVDGLQLGDNEMVHLPKYRNVLIQAFRGPSNLRVVDPAAVEKWKKKNSQQQENESPEDALTPARGFLAEGKVAYQKLDLDKALDSFSKSKREFILQLIHLRSNRELLESHLYLALTLVALSQKFPDKASEYEKQAIQEMEKVVMLDPNRELSTNNFSPQIVGLFNKVKQRITAQNRVSVEVNANVPQGKVFLNGKLLGTTPLKTRLIPGPYYFLIERPNMLPWSRLVTLEKPVEKIFGQLEGSEDYSQWSEFFRIREGGDQQNDLDGLIDMAKMVGGELVVLANLDYADGRARILGQIFDSRTNEFSQVAIADIGDVPVKSEVRPYLEEFEFAAQDMAEALSAMIRSDGYLVNSGQKLVGADVSIAGGESTNGIQEHAAPKPKLYKRWWFWAGIGVLAVGGFFAIRELGGTDGSSIVVDNGGNF